MREEMLILTVRGEKGAAYFFSGPRKKLRLGSFEEFSVEGGKPSESFLQNMKKRKISRFYALLPAEEVVFRRLILPLKEEEKISKVLGFEAEKFLPYPSEEAAISFIAAGRGKQSTDILAAAARKSVVRFYSGLLEEAGMKPAAVVPELVCIPGITGGKQTFMFIGSDDENLKMCVYKDGFPHMTGFARGGSGAVREAERLLGVFSLKEPGTMVDSLWSGAGGARETAGAVSEKFGIEHRETPGFPVVEQDLSEIAAPEAQGRLEEAAALAAAAFSGKKLLDLTERSKKPARMENPVLSGVLGFFALLLLFSSAYITLEDKQRELDSIRGEISRALAEDFEAPELAERRGIEIVSILRERLAGGGGAEAALEEIGSAGYLEVLREISLRMPAEEGLSVAGIRLDGRSCVVDGRARSLRQAETAVKSMLESDYFEGASLAGAQADGERGIVSFRIEIELPRQGRL